MTTTVAVVLLVPLLIALPAGQGAFATVAAVVAVIALLDLSGMLAAAGLRPVLPAALVPVIGMPLTAVGGDGWTTLPTAMTAAFVLTIVLVLASGRRARVTEVIGSTMFAALLPGLGAGALVLLHGLPAGTSWVLVVLLLSAVAEVGDPVGRRLWQRRAEPSRPYDGDPYGNPNAGREDEDAGLAPLLGAALAVALTAAFLVALLPDELPGSAVAGVALAAFAGARVGREALSRLAGSAGLDMGFRSARLGDGGAVLAVSTVLLAAPAAYVLAAAG